MNGFAALDINPHRRYVVDIGGRRSCRCRLHINFAPFLHSLDFTQNLGVTLQVNKKRHLPTHVLLDHNPGLKVPSIVQLEQIFTLDKQRVQRFVGRTSEKEMNQIEMAIKISLGIN